MELKALREKIDRIDDEIARLYLSRMEFVKEVAIEKNKLGIGTENTLREKEILNRVTEGAPIELKRYLKQVFEIIFETSKAYQYGLNDRETKLVSDIKNALENTADFPVSATVACQGVEGSYSSIAANKMFELSKILYFKDFENVFSAVEKGLCEYGVLPIENSSVGSVNAVYDLMRKHSFHIVKCVKLKISHCLLAYDGTKKEDIKEIFSHEQAINQCQGYLNKYPNAKITIVSNTAQAAKIVAESKRPDAACISSYECAGIYGLKTLERDIQDSENNYTRFIVISKELKIFKGADKISIMVNIPHEKGSLNKLLNKFSSLGLNLTKLESRPIAKTPFEFAFYFDFEADIGNREVMNLLGELSQNSGFVFLGSYKEI